MHNTVYPVHFQFSQNSILPHTIGWWSDWSGSTGPPFQSFFFTCIGGPWPSNFRCTFLSVDCRENVLLQGVFHPGLFVNGKWSCCEHRSKHSQGCKTSFCGNHQDVSPPGSNHVSPTKPSGAGGLGVARGPLPPTPMDEVAPTPPPHSSSSRYHGTHVPNPNTILSYEHHDLNPSQQDRGRRKGGGGIDERAAQPLPPPVPVSVCLCGTPTSAQWINVLLSSMWPHFKDPF